MRLFCVVHKCIKHFCCELYAFEVIEKCVTIWSHDKLNYDNGIKVGKDTATRLLTHNYPIIIITLVLTVVAFQ